MASVTVTYRNGRVAQLENIYIRGSKIRFLILPGKSSIHSCWCQFLCFPSSDMLRNAPMFKNMMSSLMTRRRGGAARGKSGILWAQAGAGACRRTGEVTRGDRGEFGEKVRICGLGLFYPILRSMLAVWENGPFFKEPGPYKDLLDLVPYWVPMYISSTLFSVIWLNARL